MTSRHTALLSALAIPLISVAATTPTEARPHDVAKPVKNDAVAGPYENFYWLEFVPELLAADPSRAKELEFVLSCRERLMGEYTRGPTAKALIDRFKKEFDATKVADATRLAVMSLISKKQSLAEDDDLDYFLKLSGSLKCATIEEKAYALKLRIAHAGRWCYGCDYKKDRKALFDILVKDLRAPWLTRHPMLANALFQTFESGEWTPGIFGKEPAAMNEAFLAALEKIPPESRGYPESLFIGRAHIRKAWDARGSEWASKTTGRQFEGFEKHLKIAAPELNRAHRADPRRVRPLMELMTLAMADSGLAGGDVETFLAKARKCPGFCPEVLQHAAFCSAARWCGDTTLILKITDELINMGYDGEGPYYAHLAFKEFMKDVPEDKLERCRDTAANLLVKIANGYATRDIATKSRVISGYGHPLDMRPVVLERLFEINRLGHASKLIAAPGLPGGYDDENEFPAGQARNHQYLRSLVAVESGDKTTLDDIFPVFPSALTMTEDDTKHDRIIAEKRIHHADTAWLSESDERLAALEKKLRSEATRQYLKDLRGLLASELAVMKGEKITLPFTASLWDKPYGDWKFEGKTARAGTALNLPGFHEALGLGWFRPPYELTLRVQRRWSGPGAKVGVTIGRLPGWQQAPRPAPGCCFLRQHQPDHLMVMKAFPFTYKSPVVVRAKDKVNDYTITVRVMEHGYTVSTTDVQAKGRRDDSFIPSVIAVGNYPTFPGWGGFNYDAPVIRGLKEAELSPDEKSWMQDNEEQAARRKTSGRPEET